MTPLDPANFLAGLFAISFLYLCVGWELADVNSETRSHSGWRYAIMFFCLIGVFTVWGKQFPEWTVLLGLVSAWCGKQFWEITSERTTPFVLTILHVLFVLLALGAIAFITLA